MAKIGYSRCSHFTQNDEGQIARLKQAGCQIVRSEKASGKSRAGRDELATILEFIGEHDELCCVRLDRLGRSTRDVLNLVHELHGKGASLTILEPSFSTKDAAGQLLVTVLGMVGEMERTFILERQKAGIIAAKKAGVYRGRKPSVPVDQIKDMRAAGHGPSAIAKALEISRMSVHRALKSAEV